MGKIFHTAQEGPLQLKGGLLLLSRKRYSRRLAHPTSRCQEPMSTLLSSVSGQLLFQQSSPSGCTFRTSFLAERRGVNETASPPPAPLALEKRGENQPFHTFSVESNSRPRTANDTRPSPGLRAARPGPSPRLRVSPRTGRGGSGARGGSERERTRTPTDVRTYTHAHPPTGAHVRAHTPRLGEAPAPPPPCRKPAHPVQGGGLRGSRFPHSLSSCR